MVIGSSSVQSSFEILLWDEIESEDCNSLSKDSTDISLVVDVRSGLQQQFHNIGMSICSSVIQRGGVGL